MIVALLLAAAADASTCAALVRRDPAAARAVAARAHIAGEGPETTECVGLAWAAERNWKAAAGAFTDAARAAEVAHDGMAAEYWVEAGNAWLAAGDASQANAALGTALAAGTLSGLALGEAQLDQARALVAGGQLDEARTALDLALKTAGDDPLAWLLSATLARRTAQPQRAAADIAEALKRAPEDPQVLLEAGNIAAQAGDAPQAQERWQAAARLQPDGPVGASARTALAQFAAAGTP